MSPGTNLPGVDYFLIVVPVAVALFGWVAMVYWANRHPEVRRVRGPHRSVAGGVFEGLGRSVMPTRDAVPPEARRVPSQGAAPDSESGVPEDEHPAARAATATARRRGARSGRP